jgi:hypothetical protein
MYVYRILLPSETDDGRFNSREMLNMLKYSIQPHNEQFSDLACSVCTVKYQTWDLSFLHWPRSFAKIEIWNYENTSWIKT